MRWRAVKCEFNGIRFDSQGERDCYQYLNLLQGEGKIRDLQVHSTTILLPGITHKTDFKFYDVTLRCMGWAEFKGIETDRWRIIKKLWALFGPGPLKIYKQHRNSKTIIQTEEILPNCQLGEGPYCTQDIGSGKTQRRH